MRKVWSLKQEVFEDQKLLRIDLLMQKQELRFKKGRLVNHTNMNYADIFFSRVSAYLAFTISSISRVSSKPNIFLYIDQWQEYVGSEATSSSEDG
jgi:hypothetical protein